MKTLIIIDMQNDFITGSLANKDAEAIVGSICKYIKREKFDSIIMTRDTHQRNYLETAEGKKLPVEHCIEGTAGWCVNEEIQKAAFKYCNFVKYIDKPTFGFKDWYDNDNLKYLNIVSSQYVDVLAESSEITVVGTCTDICVVSNVLILKALYPKANIKVIGNLCAGLTKEKHEAALEVMRSCQVEVINLLDILL